MKIALIRHRYDPFGGAERFTEVLMDRLASKGIEVHVYARKWKADPRSGVKIHPVGGPSWPRLLAHAGFVYLVARAIHRETFDLIQSNEQTLCQHLYRAGDGVHARWLELRRRTQGPLRRQSSRLSPFHLYRLWLERRLFQASSLRAVVVNSEMVRREITERFRIDPGKIHTIYNGVDLDRFHPRNRITIGTAVRRDCGLDDEKPVMLFVGSGFERKGLAFLIRAMAEAGGSSRLWVVGKNRTAPYGEMARKLGVQDRIHFWGPRDDVARFYAAADFFVLPTIYDPFPTVILEAMASGLPVITTRQCGAAEIITQGTEGFVLGAPSCISEMSEHIRFLSHRDKRKSMAAAARLKAESFPIEGTIEQLIELYSLLMTSN